MWRMGVFCFSQVLGLLVSGLTIIWILKHKAGYGWSAEPMKQFSWHPTLMVIGLVYLFGHGIVIFRIFPHIKKWYLKCIHMTISLMAGVCAAVGLFAVFDERANLGKDHFMSLHSWIGLGALGLYALQWVFGFTVFFLPCSTMWLRAKTIKLHTLLGKAIFILSVIATVTGIKNKAGTHDAEERILLNFLGILVIVTMLYHLMIMEKNSFKYPNAVLPKDRTTR